MAKTPSARRRGAAEVIEVQLSREAFERLHEYAEREDLTLSEAVLRLASSALTDWHVEMRHYLLDYKRQHPYAYCPLSELYQVVVEPLGVTIGQFHDALRDMARQKTLRLHPFTGAPYQLQDEQYALVLGQEIKYYAEPL